jgi:hypothetical protein
VTIGSLASAGAGFNAENVLYCIVLTVGRQATATVAVHYSGSCNTACVLKILQHGATNAACLRGIPCESQSRIVHIQQLMAKGLRIHAFELTKKSHVLQGHAPTTPDDCLPTAAITAYKQQQCSQQHTAAGATSYPCSHTHRTPGSLEQHEGSAALPYTTTCHAAI